MASKADMFNAPIPGANYTSDTRNYPWHRPPEITNLDDAIEVSFKKLMDENAATGILTMLDMGASAASLTHSFLMSGIGAGKWTPDFAILLAGPVSHIIYLMGKGYGINVDMGLDDKVRPPSKAFFKARKIEASRVKDVVKEMPSVETFQQNVNPDAAAGGMMGMAANNAPVPATENTEQPGTLSPETAPEQEVI